jgi:cysteine desulfurase
MDLIYLDNNATTRLAPEALDAMLPYFCDHYGNASAAHTLGHLSEGAVTRAREQLATLLGCQPAELVFNSGGTEGLNHVFRSVLDAFPTKRHFIVSSVEHTAVMAIMDWLRKQGAEVTMIDVDESGRLDLHQLETAIRPDTALVSIMAANNETGVIFPLKEIAHIVKAKSVLFHVDATQAIGKTALDVSNLPIDLLNLSAHKFHGPKGVGAIFIRRGLRLKPFMIGGHQERGRRGGTENVPGIVGLGKAAELARLSLRKMEEIRRWRDQLESAALDIPDACVNGFDAERLPNTSLLSFAGIEGEALLMKLNEQGICVSTGSACTTGQKEPSHVLRAMKVSEAHAKGTIRVSMSRCTTAEEIARLVELLPSLVAELRALSPFAR